jgi:hypothetical protein
MKAAEYFRKTHARDFDVTVQEVARVSRRTSKLSAGLAMCFFAVYVIGLVWFAGTRGSITLASLTGFGLALAAFGLSVTRIVQTRGRGLHWFE